MNKSELLAEMRTARLRWETILAQVDEDRIDEPTMHGGWSVKDTIGHVAYYERWLLNWVEDAVRGRVTLATHRDSLDVDERNRLIREENKNRTLNDIQSESHLAFERLCQLVKTLSEAELTDLYRFDRYVIPFWGKSLPLWECIYGDSYGHYPEHAANIRSWLEGPHPKPAAELTLGSR